MRALTASQDSKVARIVVAGFASPEGTQAVNERLAGQRADAIVDFLLANSGVDGRLISLYNGGPDWYGLREMVATSDLPDKHAVTDIIDNTPVWAVQGADRLSKLKALSGGRTYNYMLRNYFPQLRQAAFIRVYYTNEQ